MWKISRNFTFPKWCVNHQKYTENQNRNTVFSKAAAVACPFERKKSSEGNERQHFKQNERFWNCADVRYFLSRSSFLETASWLGTATVLCFNIHRKHFNSMFDNERIKSHCLFSRNVFAQPKHLGKNTHYSKNAYLENDSETSHFSKELVQIDVHSDPNTFQDLKLKSIEYNAAFHNSVGLSSLKSNKRKAFRSFQAAARLGSGQGFYNLGLCHEFGKGTKVNLNRAAFCYRKAAMRGHGLASFNLARYFHKGLGGLPVDHKIAKLLLEQAAAKDIPEAQLYLGLEYLEKENWSDAYNIFFSLASKNNIEGKYYLGLCYENGWGVNKNQRTAVEIFSQNASLGHSKSILCLAKCFEEGLGGCSVDIDFALALCQILADQGDEEGRQAFLRLKLKKETSRMKELFDFNFSFFKNYKTNGLHISSSNPDFTSQTTKKSKFDPVSLISSYLDLVTGFASLTHKFCQDKRFFMGEENISLTSSYMQYFQSNIITTINDKT